MSVLVEIEFTATMEATLLLASSETTTHFESEIERIRTHISADDEHLRVIRDRLKKVRSAAEKYSGALRSYNAGSVKHLTVNRPVDDGDAGVVLDRRSYPDLGPDSDVGDGSTAIVNDLARFVMDELAEDEDVIVVCAVPQKRAILFQFASGGSDDPNPTVDLIVALTRKDAAGLWIPNLHTNGWDASHPEGHNDLLAGDETALRVHRARAIRLAKAAVKNDAQPVLISFNIEALALSCVTEVQPLGRAVRELFECMADSIGKTATEDPCDVSGAISLPDGVGAASASLRLAHLAQKIGDAEDSADDAAIEAALAQVFPSAFDPVKSGNLNSSIATALATGSMGAPAVREGFGLSGPVKPMRSAGGSAR